MDTYLKALLDHESFAFYKTVADFGETYRDPILQWERECRLIPESAIADMGRLGLFGITVEEAFGGQGGTQLDLILMGLALGYYSHSLAITPGAASSLGVKPLQIGGTVEQKKAHLPDLAQGKRIFVFGLSEPGRGSDATNPQVTAKKVSNGWEILGEKCWSTNSK